MTRSYPASSIAAASSSVSSVLALQMLVALEGIDDVLGGDPAHEAVAQLLEHLASLGDRGDVDAVVGAAVLLGDDHVLRHVHEPPRQVAGIGGLERGVRQPLARAVGGDEVLQHRQPLAEVRSDRRRDDLAGRLRHQAAHAGDLADLLLGATGPGVGHDEDRVGLAAFLGAPTHLAEHLVGDPLGDAVPDVDDLVEALAGRDDAAGALPLDLLDLAQGVADQVALRARDDHVAGTDRDPGVGRPGEAECS